MEGELGLLGIAITALFVGMALLMLHHSINAWLLPLINSLGNPHGGFLTRIALKPITLAAKGAAWILRSVDHAISVSAGHAMAPVAHLFAGLAAWVTAAMSTSAYFAEEVAYGFQRVVSHTIPRAVSRAIAVPLHEVQLGLRHTRQMVEQLRRYARGIDTLVRDTIWPALRRVAHAVDVTLPRSLARVRAGQRVLARDFRNPSRAFAKRIWRLGWIAVGASLMVRFLTRKFPHLFCRNTTRGLKALCRMPSSLLDLLLGDALLVLAITDICDTMRAIEAVAEQAAPLLTLLVTAEDDFFDWCGGDLPSAHDAPGYKGPWRASAT